MQTIYVEWFPQAHEQPCALLGKEAEEADEEADEEANEVRVVEPRLWHHQNHATDHDWFTLDWYFLY